MNAPSRLPADEFNFGYSTTTPPPVPKSWQAWSDLVQQAPGLKQLHRQGVNQTPPPKPMSDLLFVALCAAFADPRKREILRALILDLLSDDLMDLLVEPDKDGA